MKILNPLSDIIVIIILIYISTHTAQQQPKKIIIFLFFFFMFLFLAAVNPCDSPLYTKKTNTNINIGTMYSRLLSASATLSGCRQIHTATCLMRATGTSKMPHEISDRNEYRNSEQTPEPLHDYIDITNTQRIFLSVGSSLAALVNPRR